jgi:hypothetical protein
MAVGGRGFLKATRLATPVDVRGQGSTIQHVGLAVSNTGRNQMDACGRTELQFIRTSKPLVGILGDVDGRIVPVAPPPVRIRPAVWKTVGTTLRSPYAERTGVPTA